MAVIGRAGDLNAISSPPDLEVVFDLKNLLGVSEVTHDVEFVFDLKHFFGVSEVKTIFGFGWVTGCSLSGGSNSSSILPIR